MGLPLTMPESSKKYMRGTALAAGDFEINRYANAAWLVPIFQQTFLVEI